MFHAIGVTPEPPTLHAATGALDPTLDVRAWTALRSRVTSSPPWS